MLIIFGWSFESIPVVAFEVPLVLYLLSRINNSWDDERANPIWSNIG